jgi:hypothetical protein
MRSRGESAPRSSRETIMRWGLAALAAMLGYLSVTFSLAQAMMSQNPAIAHQLAPYDGQVTARLSSLLTIGEANEATRARADRLARLALRQEPIAVTAVSTLGINAEVRGDTKTARRLFAYALELSRRDPKTQLWEIEDAATRGDVEGALHHYDIALRTQPKLSNLLYPILASASSDPAIRGTLVRTLAAKPRWGDSFIRYVTSSSADPTSAAQLFVDLQQARVMVPAEAQTGVVNALVTSGQLDEAWRYYVSIRHGASRERLRDPSFTAGLESPTLLDWVPVNEGGVVTSMQDGAFNFIVPASVGRALLQQMQLLPPGAYRIVGRSSGIEDEESARPYWTLRCSTNNREFGRLILPNSAQANGRFAGTFSVSEGCPIQTLVLMARPSFAVGGLAGRIEQVVLEPAR